MVRRLFTTETLCCDVANGEIVFGTRPTDFPRNQGRPHSVFLWRQLVFIFGRCRVERERWCRQADRTKWIPGVEAFGWTWNIDFFCSEIFCNVARMCLRLRDVCIWACSRAEGNISEDAGRSLWAMATQGSRTLNDQCSEPERKSSWDLDWIGERGVNGSVLVDRQTIFIPI